MINLMNQRGRKMANDCYNYLSIDGPLTNDVVSKVINDEGDVDYNLLVPMPDNVKELPHPRKEGNYVGERDWSWENIGCPGVTSDTDIERDDTGAFISFTSEWGPPEDWFRVLSEQVHVMVGDSGNNMDITLEYNEHDEQFAGVLKYDTQQVDDGYYTKTKFKGTQLAEALGCPQLEKTL